jgi:hypothetical protein
MACHDAAGDGRGLGAQQQPAANPNEVTPLTPPPMPASPSGTAQVREPLAAEHYRKRCDDESPDEYFLKVEPGAKQRGLTP